MGVELATCLNTVNSVKNLRVRASVICCVTRKTDFDMISMWIIY